MGSEQFANQTLLHPIGFTAVVVLGLAMLGVRRRSALIPLLLLAYFVSPAQRVAIAGLDFNGIRLLILAGWLRVILRGETRGFQWRALDTLFLIWTISSTVFFAMNAGASGIVNRLGSHVYEQFGAYLLVRVLVRDWDDVIAPIKAMMVLAFPSMAFFLLEWSTGRNIFSIFGGVPEITDLRQGRLRCQGPFTHPIIAGCAWAVWLPLFSGLWFWNRNQRWLVVMATAAACLVIISSASSTPVFTAMSAGVAVALYLVRRHIRMIRWSTLALLVGLHFVMKAPVWHLLSRISAVGGSTGYHRYLLIDNFIRRAGEWFMKGTTSTAHWGFGQRDVTNHFILQGVTGGIVTFLLFCAKIYYAFKYVGQTLRVVSEDPARRLLVWCIGAAIFTHLTAFIGVSYFGQLNLIWAIHLGIVGAMYQFEVVAAREEEDVYDDGEEEAQMDESFGRPFPEPTR